MKYDFLIVGAGFAGSILAERLASQMNKKVLLIDKRNHIAGNCYDYIDEYGVLVHKYGPHIFHTPQKKVWDYLSKFTDWNVYFHEVLAVIEGKKVPIPFNFNSIELLFPRTLASKIETSLLDNFEYGTKIPILKLRESNIKELNFLAEYVYENVFLNYNLKQWGLKPEELDPSVSARVPIILSRDNRYFQDKYQAIPKDGYTKLFENILNHPNIEIKLNTDLESIKTEDLEYEKMIYTGTIDSFFDYKFGELQYRTLNFKFENFKSEFHQEVAQINYPNNFDFTRITEFKHISSQKCESTTIAMEYSEAFQIGKNEPYYPIPNDINQEIFNKYKAEANKLAEKVLFVGRLADYKYYNMDQIVLAALQLFEKKILVKQ